MMQKDFRWLPLLVLQVLLLGCSGDQAGSKDAVQVVLGDKETFVWGEYEQPVRLAPPAGPGWERHRWQQGGLEGVSFQLRRVPPGRILVANYHLLYDEHSRIYADGEKAEFEAAPADPTIDEVVDRVRFRKASLPNPDAAYVYTDKRLEVNGWPAISLDYTWEDRGHKLFGREIYVVAQEELYVASLLGTEADVPLFEAVVASLEFPELEGADE